MASVLAILVSLIFISTSGFASTCAKLYNELESKRPETAGDPTPQDFEQARLEGRLSEDETWIYPDDSYHRRFFDD